MKKGLLIILGILLAILISGCGADKTQEEEQTEKMPSADVLEEGNDLVFSFSIDGFIDSYNSLYIKEKGKDYLISSQNWQTAEYEQGIHSDNKTIYYNFIAQQGNWSLPSVSAYTSAKSGCVQEIILEFDDHSYTEEMYKLYEEYCFYTLKIFFPDLSDERITELYKEINKQAYENIFTSEEWYGKGAIPKVMYHKDGIGVYPYFAIGQHLKMCIIPVTEQLIRDFERKGVAINEI